MSGLSRIEVASMHGEILPYAGCKEMENDAFPDENDETELP